MSLFQESAESVESQLFKYNCVIAASFVILYYDYALTFSDEYVRFWKAKRKLTFASMLFYLNRYITLLGHLPVIFLSFENWPHLDRMKARCLWINHYNEYIILSIQVLIAVISIFRTYVLYGHKRWILVLLCTVTTATIIYGMVSLLRLRSLTYTIADLPSTGCLLPVSLAMASGLAEAWSGHLIFDTLVFSLTLYKSLTTKRQGFTVVSIMMRDGTTYFGVMILASISVIVSFYIFPPHIRGLTATLTNTLSSTVISRLMLNLRDPKLEKDSAQLTHISGLVFDHATSRSSSEESRYSEDEDEDDEYSPPVHRRDIMFDKLKLPELYFDENSTRDVLKSLGIDVREIV